ncbi:DUF2163 domain-containing protein [Candidatus Phycosocius spiralis]|uniref:Bacteriophage phiJL001 Gp84 C-terminal domain-containing protein n=1 Tax=Candidatus Phycosocius spiralis TaxID=2815099 RepID=A0ABQ4PXD6_9PROT|nr:DUF2163 domain-containing protein [Candidatus Phycosocius spiralis]GIU67611.1 hypothetical protein PsB1_1765 [Candidatus Phycosocius spiralis]
MRQLNPALTAKLVEGVTTLARAWRLTRKDGFIVAATEHDRDLTRLGTLFQASISLRENALEKELSLSPGHGALSGALRLDRVSEADVRIGLWDQAKVEAFAFDWTDAESAIHLWSGTVQSITCQGHAFELSITSLDPNLNQVIGKVYARTCDAQLGDGRCKADLSTPTRSWNSVITSIPNDRTLIVPKPAAIVLDHWVGGSCAFQTGPAANWKTSLAKLEFAQNEIALALAQPMPIMAQAGNRVLLKVGCDKSYATCRDRFQNQLNFRGVPTLPGDDAVFSGPAISGNTGGRR